MNIHEKWLLLSDTFFGGLFSLLNNGATMFNGTYRFCARRIRGKENQYDRVRYLVETKITFKTNSHTQFSKHAIPCHEVATFQTQMNHSTVCVYMCQCV